MQPTPRPSSLPALDQCSCFQSGTASGIDDKEGGTDRHAALSGLLATHPNAALAELLPDDDREMVERAAEYIKSNASAEFPLTCEETRILIDSDFNTVMQGTPDVVSGCLDLFDLKTRIRDYTAQIAAYAAMILQDAPLGAVIKCHVIYTVPWRVETFNLTHEAAMAIVKPILDRVAATDKTPTPCDYCGWCELRLTCKAHLDRVNAVQDGREDWTLGNYHVSEITTPEQMGKALTLARLLAGWCEACEWAAKKMAKEGKCPDGFVEKEKAGRKYLTDIKAAYAALDLPQDDFFRCCELRLQSSKKYPDKIGAYDLLKIKQGLNTFAAAKRDGEKRLAGIIKQGQPSVSLVAVSGNAEKENEE